ncbi:MAG TPA: four helix bundle protein [Bacteroidales bacterium]|nr:four helix bundle protein [Bacteroidales bacterium]
MSVYSKNFKHQLIWQKSLELVQEIYALTRQLDITKQKNLITQLRNNVDALHSNIALSLIKIYSNSYNDIILQSLDLCDNLRAQILLLLKDQYITEIIANDKLEKINTIYQALYELLKEKNLPYSSN